MTRRRLLLAAVLLGLAATVALPRGALVPPAAAQSEGDGEKEREKTPEEKELARIGKEFAAKDSAALVDRVPEKRKLRLILGKYDDRYGKEQAKQVLDDWFESRSITLVKLTKTSDSVG